MNPPNPIPGGPDPSTGLETARPALAQARKEAAAAERQRLAQTLHDTVAQSLTAVYFVAKGIETKLRQDGSDVADKIASLADMLHQASEELHACMRELKTDRPPGGDG